MSEDNKNVEANGKNSGEAESGQEEIHGAIRDEAHFLTKSGNIISIIGAVFLMIGMFLPWLVLGPVSASGMSKLGIFGIIYLGVGVFVILLSVAGLKQHIFFTAGDAAIGIIGIASSIWLYTYLKRFSEEINELGVSPDIGYGFWVTCFGLLAIVIGAVVSLVHKKRKQGASG